MTIPELIFRLAIAFVTLLVLTNSISDVFYAEIQKDGKLYIDPKNDVLH